MKHRTDFKVRGWFAAMSRVVALASFVLVTTPSVRAQTDRLVWTGPCSPSCNPPQIQSAFVVSVPSGGADYCHRVFDVAAGLGNVDQVLVDGMQVAGAAVSLADFGSGRTFPTVGLFYANLGIDPTGSTPDLANDVVSLASPALPSVSLFEYARFEATHATIASGATKVAAVVQLPPGDSGLLGVGADSMSAIGGRSGFTSNGYATPALPLSFVDLGLSVAQDNSATPSCKQADRKPHGRLRGSNLRRGIGEGDHLTLAIRGGQRLDLAFFGNHSGDLLRLYFNLAPCTPAIAIGPVLPAIAQTDGDGSYVRVNATWPAGYGGQTFRFSAVWGNAGCGTPGVGFTNCITVVALPDLTFGVCDDGTVERGWVVQMPTGSSDYFNNSFGPFPSSANGIVQLTVGVQDFGTASPAYPAAGVSTANLTVDATGNTPDVSGAGLLALVAPFSFPAATFASTSGQYTSHPVSVPKAAATGPSIHGWIQFPPGDSGLLRCGTDTTTPNDCSFFSPEGYASPAIGLPLNWAIRLTTN